MRFLKRILIKLSIISMISFICIVAIWKGFSADQRLKIAIEKRFNDASDGTLNIGSLQFYPTSIQLRDVDLSDEEKFQLAINNCNIDISVYDLVLSKGDWKKSIKKVVLYNPQLIISDLEPTNSLNPDLPYYSKEFYQKLKLLFPAITLEIVGASIRKSTSNLTIFQSIDASITRDETSILSVKANGNLTSSIGTKMNLNGKIDLLEEELLFDLAVNNEDMSNFSIDSTNRNKIMLNCVSGWFQSRFELRGRDELLLTGNVAAHDIAISYGKSINLTVTNLKGELFGKAIEFQGNAAINGLQLPFRGSVNDIFHRSWQLVVDEKNLNSQDLMLFNSKRSILNGNLDVNVELSGDNFGYQGNIHSNSKVISIQNIPIHDVEFEISIAKGTAQIEGFYGSIFGADLELGGLINLKTGENRLDWFIDKVHHFDENLEWLGLDSNFVSMTGALSGVAGEVVGSGNCELKNSDGGQLLSWNYDIVGEEVYGQFDGDKDLSTGEFKIDLSQKPFSIFVSGQNPHRLMKLNNDTKILSNEFLTYNMDYTIKGDLNGVDYYISLVSADSEQSLILNGILTVSNPTEINSSGEFRFNLPTYYKSQEIESENIFGKFDVSYSNDKFVINQFEVLDQADSTLITAEAYINTVNSDSSFIDLRISNLPFPALVRFFNPEIIPILGGKVDGKLITKGKHSDFSFAGIFMGSNIPPYDLILSGYVENSDFHIEDFSLENEDNERVFGFQGGINLKEMKIDTVTAYSDNLIIEHFVKSYTGKDTSGFGGRFNMVANISGELPYPNIKMNAHLASAFFHNMSGFWANIHLNYDDSTYIIQNTDVGLDLKKIADVDGKFSRDSNIYEFNLISAEHDVNDFVQLITGKPDLIAGASNLKLNINNHDTSHTLSAEASVISGKIGKVGFDDLSSEFTVTNLGSESATVSIDTFGISWGDFAGNLTGSIPLNTDEEMAVRGDVNGNLLAFLPRISAFFNRPQGSGSLEFTGGGTISEPVINNAHFRLSQGSINLKDIVSQVTSLNIDLSLDSSGVLKVNNFSGEVEEKPFHISNRFPEFGHIESLNLDSSSVLNKFDQSIIIEEYNIGILQFETGKDGIRVRIPGLMERDWNGYTIFSGMDNNGPFEFSGPASKPTGTGKIKLRKAAFTYPFVKKKKGQKLQWFPKAVLSLLKRMEWDAQVVPEWGCKYVKEISGLRGMPYYDEIQESISSPLFDLDLKLYLDLDLDPSIDGLSFSGSIIDSFEIAGELRSTQGTIEYLDMKFNTQSILAEFNQAELNPLFYGSAVTTIIDSAGVPREIRLVTRRNAGEGAGGFTINQDAPAQWDNLSVLFEDDQNNSQEEILALLGYAPETLDEKLPGLGGSLVEKAIPIKRFTRRLERQLERWLNVDRIEIDPTLTQNIIQQQISSAVNDNRYVNQHDSYLQILDQSSVTLGKYITRDIYVSYTGLIQNGADKYNFTRLGMLHNWDALFRLWQIAPNLNLNYRYQYDSIAEQSDQSFHIRYNFTFNL